MKQTYIRCPRCELNYILKKDKVCNVCKLEMKALGTLAAEENLDLELCPICKINYINPDEDICPQCAKERELEEGESGKYDRDNEWSSYTGNDDDADYSDDENGDMVSITNLDDTPISDDEMDLGIDDEDSEGDDDVFDGDDLDEDDLDDDYDDDDDDLDDDIDDPKPSKRKK